MTAKNVIITDCDHGNIELEEKVLNRESVTYELKQLETEEELIEFGQGAEVFINQYAPITAKVLENLPDLKMIVRYGVGVNNIDVEAATKNGVQICNVPDYGTNEVADHALAMMLNFTRKIGLMNQFVRRGEWDYQQSIPLFRHSKQTVGVIGVGRIGKSFAKKVHALGCKVIGYDTRYEEGNFKEVPDYIEMTDFMDLIENSDIISIHCPLEKAYHLIDEAELKKMKNTAYLINVSRGGIINESALDKALEGKWIAGAAVDVTEIEPLDSSSQLFRHENFICTPHMAWYTEQAAQELKRKVAEEAVRFLKGEAIHYPINNL